MKALVYSPVFFDKNESTPTLGKKPRLFGVICLFLGFENLTFGVHPPLFLAFREYTAVGL
jgi:hypothetical protein